MIFTKNYLLQRNFIYVIFVCFITERYDYVGKLLKPGEAPTNYSDEEDEGSQQETETKSETDRSETVEKSKSD